MSIPFVYCLKSKDGHLYFGSKIGEDSDPKQLMETYFTSSKYVKDLMKTKGNDYFQVVGIEIFPGKPEEAFWKEQQLIESSYDNPMLLNKHYQTVGTKPWTQLGRKGNKQYLFGKGHLRAGKNNPMFGKQGAMKGITGKDHPAYGVDRSGDKNGMFGKCGELHHHYGTPPWEVPISKKLGTSKHWLVAEEIRLEWVAGARQCDLSRKYGISIKTIETMVGKFRSGWIPSQDPQWVNFKGGV
ncbi:GIY-YIG homing endonuclease [Salmonella phage allotria]|uniref:GIY-YIG homing endonuclease n=2 Tax=Kuttervirus TaxID=2169536 RepID=A0A6G8RLY2_9CAUD|nr:homing endonuclease [Salmonella phage allotria]YP_009889207.1 homing endonuclease [Salmonella phage maane]YP_009966888.1 homing endonuclease [Salmonella phage Se-J]ECW1086559.1 hypothetical protein [Salmonella enterica]QPX74806.1 putative homing endonuclease [Salmonella phage SilasIsHot]QIO02407.1 GIY-YIG homing endonuclease [Salmonella phage allotria]QIO03479.1 GIY-YIG homing endonuclease [Salmonella phage maane]